MAKFPPERLAPLWKMDLDGSVDVLPIAGGYDSYRGYMRQFQVRTHGLALFDYREKATAQRENRLWVAQARVDGKVVV